LISLPLNCFRGHLLYNFPAFALVCGLSLLIPYDIRK